MTQKPDFQQMSRKELRTYVLAHREDNEGFPLSAMPKFYQH